jgi:hypothetical protein
VLYWVDGISDLKLNKEKCENNSNFHLNCSLEIIQAYYFLYYIEKKYKKQGSLRNENLITSKI